VSSSSRGGGSPHEQGGSSTSSCRRTMSEVVSTGGKWTPGSRKEEEQQHFKQLQEQEQARALAATLQAITMCLCYYAQTQRTSPTSASGFNNSTITGGVHISNTNNDGTESEPSITKCQIADPTIFSASSENTFWRKGGRPTSPFHENLSFRSCVETRDRPRGSFPHLRHRFPYLLSTCPSRMVPG